MDECLYVERLDRLRGLTLLHTHLIFVLQILHALIDFLDELVDDVGDQLRYEEVYVSFRDVVG